MRSGAKRLFVVLMMSTALTATLPVSVATAQEASTRAFNIPPQPLEDALTLYGQQAGMMVSVDAALLAGKNAPGVSGSLPPTEALQRLLAGSGLSWHQNGRTLVIAAADAADAGDGANMLGTIVVSSGGAGFQGTPDWVYAAPRSVSVVTSEALRNNPPRHANDVFDDVAGVYTADNPQDPGLNVNIRGMQDQTRVNTMIDGVRQNFQLSGHSSTGFTYLDPAMIRSVEVEKTATSGVGGAATLAGSVNFRTIESADLIELGEKSGFELDVTTGTNAYDFKGSIAGAYRFSDTVAVTAALSHKKLGDYKIGRNGEVTRDQYVYDEDPDYTNSETWSGLLKSEIDLASDQKVTLSWLGYKGDYATGSGQYIDTDTTTNNTFRAAYEWNPDSDLIDLKADIWYNAIKVDQYRPARSSYGAFDVDYKLNSVGGSIQNTSIFLIGSGELALNYGVELFQDKTDTIQVGEDPTDDPDNLWFAGANPIGTRSVYSAFINADYDVTERLSLKAGLRYDHYDMDATATALDFYTYSYTDIEIDKSEGRLVPTAAISYDVTEGLELFASYSEGFRPPNLMEAALGGDHIGVNYGMFTANPNLDPEVSKTWEVGANIRLDGLITPDDQLRLKLALFDRDVSNYILYGFTELGQIQYVNAIGNSSMKGTELEFNYDAGRYYLGGSYTYLNADISQQFNWMGMPMDGGIMVYVPPKEKFTIEGGLRFMEERLTLGARATHASKTVYGGAGAGGNYVEGYTVYDLFGIYALTEAAEMRFSVNNVTDKAYADSMGLPNYPAPGRTVTASFNMKF